MEMQLEYLAVSTIALLIEKQPGSDARLPFSLGGPVKLCNCPQQSRGLSSMAYLCNRSGTFSPKLLSLWRYFPGMVPRPRGPGARL